MGNQGQGNDDDNLNEYGLDNEDYIKYNASKFKAMYGDDTAAVFDRLLSGQEKHDSKMKMYQYVIYWHDEYEQKVEYSLN